MADDSFGRMAPSDLLYAPMIFLAIVFTVLYAGVALGFVSQERLGRTKYKNIEISITKLYRMRFLELAPPAKVDLSGAAAVAIAAAVPVRKRAWLLKTLSCLQKLKDSLNVRVT